MSHARARLLTAGLVLTAAPLEALAQQLALSHPSAVVGAVVDSLHGGPLPGARVTLAGTPHSALTDSAGRFRIEGVRPGRYRIDVGHPLLDSLALSIGTKPLDLAADKAAVVVLAVPPVSSLLAMYCPAGAAGQGPPAVLGRVRDSDTEVPVPGATVSLSWTEYEVVKGRQVRRTPQSRSVVTGEDGSYAMCGLPPDVSARLRAELAGVSTSDIQVALTADSSGPATIAVRTLHLPVSPVASAADSSAARPGGASARGAIAGHVISKSGAPVPDAEVSVAGDVRTVKTDANGDFTLRGLAAGTQVIAVRRIGFAPVETQVELSRRTLQHVTITLGQETQVLEAVRVKARRDRGLAQVGFADRQHRKLGKFITREDIEREQPMHVSDLLRHAPGLVVQPVGAKNVLLASRSLGGDCVNLFVDGVQQDAAEIDTYQPQELAAVEVYNSASTPPDFITLSQPPTGVNPPVDKHANGAIVGPVPPGGNPPATPRYGCSTVVLWTRVRVGDDRSRPDLTP